MEDYKIYYIPSIDIYFFTKSELGSRIKTAKTNAINEYLISKGLTPTKVLIPYILIANITSTRTGVINKIKELKPDFKPINKDLNKDRRNGFNNKHIIKCNICDKDIKYFSSKAHFNTKKHKMFEEAINNFSEKDLIKNIVQNEEGGFCMCCNLHFENNNLLEEHIKSQSHYRKHMTSVVRK